MKQAKEPKMINLTPEDYDKIVETLKESNLPKKLVRILIKVMDSHLWLRQELMNGKLTIKKLKRLFKCVSEKFSDLFSRKEKKPKKKKKKRNGGGGKRAIDKNVVTLLGDRINSVSMSKEQRLLQQGHDEWYIERRDLYQTLLYEAHTAKGVSSQRGILSYVKGSGTYTPPPPKSPIPSARVLRRAHMMMEMEKLPDYRASIFSMT